MGGRHVLQNVSIWCPKTICAMDSAKIRDHDYTFHRLEQIRIVREYVNHVCNLHEISFHLHAPNYDVLVKDLISGHARKARSE